MCLANIKRWWQNRHLLKQPRIHLMHTHPVRDGTYNTFQYTSAAPLTVFESKGGNQPRPCPKCGAPTLFKPDETKGIPPAMQQWGYVCSSAQCGWVEPRCIKCGKSLPWNVFLWVCEQCRKEDEAKL